MPEQKTLYMHVGPPKTGTSAIQAVLRDLDDPNLTYPQAGQWPDGSHNQLAFSLNGLRNWGAIAIPPVQEVVAAMSEELAASPQDAVVSSEGFANPNMYKRCLRALEAAISGFDRIVPIVALRHPLERAASDYNQTIKDPAHGEKRLPDAFLRQTIHNHLLSPMVESWTQISDDVAFLPYHPAETVVPRFFDLIGRPDLAPETPEWRNRSLGGVGLALLLSSNRVQQDADGRAAFWADLTSRNDIRLWRGTSFPFSEAAVRECLSETVEPDLQTLNENHGVELSAWAPPPQVDLSVEDREKVMHVAAELLPASPTLETDLTAIMDALEGRG